MAGPARQMRQPKPRARPLHSTHNSLSRCHGAGEFFPVPGDSLQQSIRIRRSLFPSSVWWGRATRREVARWCASSGSTCRVTLLYEARPAISHHRERCLKQARRPKAGVGTQDVRGRLQKVHLHRTAQNLPTYLPNLPTHLPEDRVLAQSMWCGTWHCCHADLRVKPETAIAYEG